MTPKQAVRNECCWCNNTKVFHGCSSMECKLNDFSMTYIQRIKAHCLMCCPEQSVFGVQACDKKIDNFGKDRICPLFAFRGGKNPSRVHAGRVACRKNLASFQFKTSKCNPNGSVTRLKGQKNPKEGV